MPIFRKTLSRFSAGCVLSLLCFFLASCGGGFQSNQPEVTLEQISVNPKGQSVMAGTTLQYTATGSYSDGTTQVLTNVAWSTSNSALATISQTGLLTAIAEGNINVVAVSGTLRGTSKVTVSPPNLVSISVAANSPTIAPNQTTQFSASGVYSDGTTPDITSMVTWSSSAPSIATINATGIATGLNAGTAMIQASFVDPASGAMFTGSTPLTVAFSRPTTSFTLGPSFASGGTNSKGIVVADFTSDGLPDIAVANGTSDTIAVFVNDGTGTFTTTPPIVTTLALPPLGALVSGDFNGDGMTDLVVSTNDGTTQAAYILLGKGDGTFQAPVQIPNVNGFNQAVATDLNGDAHLDLIFAQNGGITVALGNGDGTFSSVNTLSGGSTPGNYQGLTVADFNKDFNSDIVAVDHDASPMGALVFFPGKGDGTFGTPTVSQLDAVSPVSVASADLNSDGNRDLLVGYASSAQYFTGNGDGTFNLSSPETIASDQAGNASGGLYVYAADLDLDGLFDTVVLDSTTGGVQIELNQAIGNGGPGTFTFTLGAGISTAALKDINGDGTLDLVVLNSQTGQITIILSAPPM